MTDKKKLYYEDVEATSADQLIELSYERLDGFITEATHIRLNAEAVISWLKSIKSVKAQRARSARALKEALKEDAQ